MVGLLVDRLHSIPSIHSKYFFSARRFLSPEFTSPFPGTDLGKTFTCGLVVIGLRMRLVLK